MKKCGIGENVSMLAYCSQHKHITDRRALINPLTGYSLGYGCMGLCTRVDGTLPSIDTSQG